MCVPKVQILNMKAYPSVQQVVYSSHPHVGFKHLKIHHVEWHGVGLATTKITLAMFKTFYNDLRIMHWIPKVYLYHHSQEVSSHTHYEANQCTQIKAMYHL